MSEETEDLRWADVRRAAGMLFIAAITLSAMAEIISKHSLIDPIIIARMLGGAVGIFLFSGVVPLVLWAFGGFRPRAARAPMLTWVLMLGAFGLAHIIATII